MARDRFTARRDDVEIAAAAIGTSFWVAVTMPGHEPAVEASIAANEDSALEMADALRKRLADRGYAIDASAEDVDEP